MFGRIQRILRGALSSDATWLVALSAISVPITLVNGILTARALGPASRGDYSAIVAFTTVLTFFASAGISESMIMQSGSVDDSMARAKIAWIHSLSIGVLAAIPVAVYSASIGQDSVAARLLAATLPVAGVMGTLAVSQLIAKGDIRYAAMVGVIPYIIQLATLLLLLGIGRVSLVSVLLAYWLSSFLAGLVGLLRLQGRATRRSSIHMRRVRAFYAQLRSLGGSQMVRALSSRVDLVVAGFLMTSTQTGIYSVALAPVMAGGAIVGSLSPLVLKRAHAGDSKMASVSVLFALIVAIGLSTVAPPFVTLLYGKDYAAASSLLMILSVGLIANVVFDVVLRFTQAEGRPGVGFAGTIIALIFQVIALVSLGTWLGLPGIALGNAIGYGAGAVFLLRMGSRSFLRRMSPMQGLSTVLTLVRASGPNR